MRYVAKLHVLDVLEDVVVSGYVYDADPLSDPEHEVHEFSLTTRGRGLDDPFTWLLIHLYQALDQMTKPPGGGSQVASLSGGPHTLSGSGDLRQNTVR